MQTVDTLIFAAHVVPVEPRGGARGPRGRDRRGPHRGGAPRGRGARAIRREARRAPRRHALIPGLVNLHCHAAMTLMRGLADDLPLMTWLQDHIWPAEAKHVSDEFVHDGSLLAMAEMLRGGITCVNDMYFFPEATARAALRAGMRACLGIIAIEFPSAYAPDARGLPAKGLATRDAYQRRAAALLLPRAACAVHGRRRDAEAHRGARRGARPPDPHARARDARRDRAGHRAARRAPARAPAPPRARGPAPDRRARGAPRADRDRPPGARGRERRALPVVEPQARERHRARRRRCARAASAWASAPTARRATTASTC